MKLSIELSVKTIRIMIHFAWRQLPVEAAPFKFWFLKLFKQIIHYRNPNLISIFAPFRINN
jgi:hypothetical protein